MSCVFARSSRSFIRAGDAAQFKVLWIMRPSSADVEHRQFWLDLALVVIVTPGDGASSMW